MLWKRDEINASRFGYPILINKIGITTNKVVYISLGSSESLGNATIQLTSGARQVLHKLESLFSVLFQAELGVDTYVIADGYNIHARQKNHFRP